MSNLKAQGSKAFIWDFFGKIAMHGIGFVVSIILARMLSPSDFGLVAMVMVIIGIASIFSDIGLGSALIQRRRVRPIHYSSVFFFNIAIGSLLTLITYLSAPFIAAFYNNEALVSLTQVIAFTFVLGAFSSVQSTKLRKELNYALLTKVAFLSSLLSGIVGVSMAFYGASVWSLVAQALSQKIFYNIFIWSASHWKPSMSFSLKALLQLWAFGFRMFLSGLLDTIFTRLDIMIIGKLFSPATLGFFNLAKQLDGMVIQYSSGSLMSVLFPVLSKIKNDLPRFQNVVIRSLEGLVFVIFFLLGGLYLTSHELIVLLFGEKWLQSVEYFRILLLSGFGYPISSLLVNVLSSRGNSKAFLRLEIYKKIIFGTNLAIGFIWGVEGYLYGLFFAMTLAVYVNIVFVSHEIRMDKIKFIKPIISQMLLTVGIVILLTLLNENFEYGNGIAILVKGVEYVVLYFIINKVLTINSYVYFMDEAKPVYIKLLQKMRR